MKNVGMSKYSIEKEVAAGKVEEKKTCIIEYQRLHEVIEKYITSVQGPSVQLQLKLLLFKILCDFFYSQSTILFKMYI